MTLQPALLLRETVDTHARTNPVAVTLRPESALNRALQKFRPVGLEEMQDLALLRRTDVKYLVPRPALPALLDGMAAAYRVLEVDGLRLQRYETLYFDTPALDLYLLHHNGARRRFKIRSRRYLESELSFLEIKIKERGDRTVKFRRRTAAFVQLLGPQWISYLLEHTGDTRVPLDTLRPTLWNTFSRLTLVSEEYSERVTIDLNLTLQRGAKQLRIDDQVVIEVKGEAAQRDTPVVRQLRALGLLPTGFSKYCIGVASLCTEVKHNHFIKKLRRIQHPREESYCVA